jgi:hypothetical protein
VGAEIATAGGVRSTVKETVVAATFPAESVAVTVTAWPLSVREPVLNGELQLAAAAASSLQVVVTEVASVEVKATFAEVVLMNEFAAGEEIATTGAIESTVIDELAAADPAEFVAVTTKVCAP